MIRSLFRRSSILLKAVVGLGRFTLCGSVLVIGCAGMGDKDGLAQEEGFPCRLVFTPTGVSLGPDPTMSRPDPVHSVVRDSKGNFYTDASVPGKIMIWSPDGSFQETFGRVGEGPGEFSAGAKWLFISTTDTLYVRDGRLRWSVFDPDHNFIRSFREVSFTGLPRSTHVLADGRIAGTVLSGASIAPLPMARINRPDGSPDHDIGTSTDSISVSRRSAYDGSATIWIAPDGMNPSKTYRLEQWDTSGKLLNVIERSASWYVPSTKPHPRGVSWPPYIASIAVDSAGILLVHSVARFPGITTEFGVDSMRRLGRALPVELHLEAIDPATRTVLASTALSAAKYPIEFFGNSRVGYVVREDSNGFVTIQVMKWDLVGEGNPACRSRLAAQEQSNTEDR